MDSLACLAYSMIIGDLISALVLSAGISGVLAKRSTAIIAVTGGVVAPLCFLKSLSALSFTSILGVLGVVFSTAVMVRGCAPFPPAFFKIFLRFIFYYYYFFITIFAIRACVISMVPTRMRLERKTW